MTHKQMLIIQDKNKAEIDSAKFTNQVAIYKIQPGDILSIDIASVSSSDIELFNQELEQHATSVSNEATIFLKGKIVNEKGEIELPLVGSIQVSNLTTTEISALIKEKLDSYVKYVTVATKLTSFRITILGEVKSPGTFTIYNSNINILQALGEAGDISDLGNRHKVKLVRKTPAGSVTAILDVSKSEIINSPYFYLQPNDVIYIAPHTVKMVKVNGPTLQVTISLLTLAFLILNFTK